MKLGFSDEQNLFADSVDRLLERACAFEKRRAQVAAGAWGDPWLWRKLAELGCFALAVPETSGGLGGGAVEVGILMRALGRRLAIEPVREAIVAGQLLAGVRDAEALLEAVMVGTSRYGVVFGDGSGSGRIQSAHGALEADGLLLAGPHLLARLAADAADFEIVRMLDDTIGVDVTFDLAAARQMAVADDWEAVRARAEALNRVALVFDALGSLEGALAETVRYVSERRQFGRPIAAFQVVQHRVAEMVVYAREAEAAAWLAATTLDALKHGLAVERALIVATRRVAAAAEFVADGAVQLHGGMGVSDETPVAAHFRKLQAFRLAADPSDEAADRLATSGAHRRSAVLLEA